MNSKKLKALLILRGESINGLLTELDRKHALKISRSSFYRKMNGISEFDRREILAISEELHMEEGELIDIFFNEKVS